MPRGRLASKGLPQPHHRENGQDVLAGPVSDECAPHRTSAEGTDVTELYSGYVARVIQHEIDHLHGVEFVDRMTSMKSLTTVTNYLEFHR
jgi:hypothetical protein